MVHTGRINEFTKPVSNYIRGVEADYPRDSLYEVHSEVFLCPGRNYD